MKLLAEVDPNNYARLQDSPSNDGGLLRPSVVLLFALAEVGYPLIAIGRTYLGLLDDSTVAYLYRLAFLLISLYVFVTHKRAHLDVSIAVTLALFWQMYICRIVYDVQIDPQSIEAGASKVLFYSIGASLLPMLGFLVPPNRQELRLAAIGTAIGLGLLCGTTWLLPGTQQSLVDTGRPGSALLNSISLGHLGAALAILSVYLMISGRQTLRSWHIAAATFGFGLGIFTLVSAGSRGPVVAFVVMLWLLLRLIVKTMRFKIALALCAVGVLLWFTATNLRQYESGFAESGLENIVERSYTESDEGDQYVRAVMIRDGWAQFLESPLLGSGLVEKNTGDYPHNIIIEAFMATGLIGGISLTIFLMGGARAAWRIIQLDLSGCWVALLFVQSLVGSMTSGALWSWQPLWCFGVATGCLAFGLCTERGTQAVPLAG